MRRKRRSVRIEQWFPNEYNVIKDRGDGVAWSVGTAKTLATAKKIKKKNLWSKKRGR